MTLPDSPLFSEQGVQLDAYAYHYTSVRSAAAIALTGRFRLGRMSEMNDPRESEWRGVALILDYVEDARGCIDSVRALGDPWNSCRANVRVGCFSRDVEAEPDSFGQARSRGYARPTMWAHYAANHTGVCLLFDRAELTARVHTQFGPEVLVGDVQYGPPEIDDSPPTIDLSGVDVDERPAHVRRAFRAAAPSSLFRKNTDWSPENEWRCAALAVDPDEEALVDIRDLVRGMVIGLKPARRDYLVLQSIVEALGISDAVASCYQSNVPVLDVGPVPNDILGDR